MTQRVCSHHAELLCKPAPGWGAETSGLQSSSGYPEGRERRIVLQELRAPKRCPWRGSFLGGSSLSALNHPPAVLLGHGASEVGEAKGLCAAGADVLGVFGCPWRDKRKRKCSGSGGGFPAFSRTGAHFVRFVLVAVTWSSHCYQPRHFSTPKLWFPVPRCCHHFTGTPKCCWELARWPQTAL